MNIGVIFAGGVGTRMHSKDKPKQFLDIYSKPVIIHTLEKFEECGDIDAVTISCIEDWIPYLKELLFKYRINKVKKVVPGGITGQMSIYNALVAAEELVKEALAEGKKVERSIALIHDGVRPRITPELISKNIECVKKYGSAITTGVVKETVVVVDEDEHIISIPERAKCRVAKAPESFWLDEILNVQRDAIKRGTSNIYDTVTLMNEYGYKMHMIEGPNDNIKVTTQEDIYTLRGIYESIENDQLYGNRKG